jgi:hypothetical protein
MIKELIYFLMVMFTQETMLMVNQKAEEFINGKMEVYIKVNSKKE